MSHAATRRTRGSNRLQFSATPKQRLSHSPNRSHHPHPHPRSNTRCRRFRRHLTYVLPRRSAEQICGGTAPVARSQLVGRNDLGDCTRGWRTCRAYCIAYQSEWTRTCPDFPPRGAGAGPRQSNDNGIRSTLQLHPSQPRSSSGPRNGYLTHPCLRRAPHGRRPRSEAHPKAVPRASPAPRGWTNALSPFELKHTSARR